MLGNSGGQIIALLETIKRLGLRMVTLTGHPRSTIAAASDVVLDVSVKEEACSLNLAPTASTTATMAMGDALAVSLLDRRGFGPEISPRCIQADAWAKNSCAWKT